MDRNWFLDGAAVHVSIVGFDGDSELNHELDGARIEGDINSDLSGGSDTTSAVRLVENESVHGSVGTQKGSDFDLDLAQARTLLTHPGPVGSPIEVIRPWTSGIDVTTRHRGKWIIYFPSDMVEGIAA